MEEGKEIQTKVCKCCGEEKPVSEFNKMGMDKNKQQKYHSECKICSWYYYHKKYELLPKWNIHDLNMLIDNLINKKIVKVNDLIKILQKPLNEIVKMIYVNKISTNKIPTTIKCKNCNKMIDVWVCDIIHNRQFCSKKCQQTFKKLELYNQKINNTKKCNICGKVKSLNEFGLDKHRLDGHNNKCKVCNRIARLKDRIVLYDDWTIEDLRIILDLSLNKKINDINAMQSFIPNKSIKDILIFASKNNLKLYNLHVKTKCLYCNKDILVRKDEYLNYNNYFCNRKCKNDYLQKDNIQCTCDWCKKVITKTRSAFESRMRKHHFCSADCSQKFFENITIKTDKWKTMLKKNAINNLQNGVYKTNSSIQIKVNNILQKLNEEYINEYPIGYYALDNYLLKHNLLIEVMGGYWHCDHRKYNKIQYEMQRRRIINDRTKKSYILNKYGIKILYLWEDDINNNELLCEKLIQYYIKNKGIISNYHSFNYCLNKKNILLKNNIEKPYMEWSTKELDRITDYTKYNQFKFKISTICNNCGKDIVISKSKYEKSLTKAFYCSRECSIDYLRKMSVKNRINVNCELCNKKFTIVPSKYNKYKHNYCSKECYDKAQTTSIIKKCENCGKIISVIPSKIKINKHFFCSNNCSREFRNTICKIKNMQNKITISCNNCGKDMQLTSTQINKSKLHFCNIKCKNEYYKNRSIKQCKVCNQIKSINEFNNLRQTCRVCEWIKKNKLPNVSYTWSKEEIYIVLDNILNKKVECINDILNKLYHKTLQELIELVQLLRIKNKPIKVKISCDICNKAIFTTLYKLKINKYHYCSNKCKNKSLIK